MATWLNDLGSKFGSFIGKRPGSAHVGAFGKHPGWDDHLDDIGLNTEPLIAAKQYLYVQGIGGVIDAGYRGEILILMTNLGDQSVQLAAGDKIAQMIPVHVLTGPVEEAENLQDSSRAEKGFGSSGK